MSNDISKGDLVKVREDLVVGNTYNGASFTSSMENLKGEKLTVSYIFQDETTERIFYILSRLCWTWTREMFDKTSSYWYEEEYVPLKLKVGDKVLYTPSHIYGDFYHPACEKGVVKSFNSDGDVFIDYGYNTKLTPKDLVFKLKI